MVEHDAVGSNSTLTVVGEGDSYGFMICNNDDKQFTYKALVETS